MKVIQDTRTEKQAKNKARIATALVGLLVLLALFFISFTIDEELEEDEEGILVNFGTLDVGSGDIQPQNIAEDYAKAAETESEKQLAVPKEESKPQTEPVDESPLTQKDETVNITKEQPVEKEPRPKEESQQKPQQEQTANDQKESQPTVNQRDLYPGKRNNSSSGEGITGDEGDQGSINGVPDKGAYQGNNSGLGDSGVGYSLSGRKMIQSPALSDNSNAVGKITVKIKVDQNGNVIDASLGTPTTISSSSLVNKALTAAKRAKFNKNASAAEEQFGTITFVFKVT